MKKVLFVATVSGHIKAFHLPYLKLFKDCGYKTFVSANYNGKNGEMLEYADFFYKIPIKRNPLSLKNIVAIRKLKKIMNNEKFDIIHCHTPMGGVVARLASIKSRKKYKTRVIYTAHGFHFFKGAPKKNWLLFYPVEWFLAKYTDTLITINKEDYNLAKNKFGKRCKDIQYVPGVGIDIKKFDIKLSEKEKIDLRKSLGLKKEDYILTCVARLDENKNQGFLIECMKDLVKQDNNIHLLLVGPDELNGFYQNMVEKYNLESNIHILGKREDIPQLLNISNLLLSASKREGLPANVIEAFAAGIPVVALCCRGMQDLIKNGKNGFIVYPNNVNKFSDKIIEIVYDGKIKKEMVRNNINDSNKFSLETVIREYKRIYKI